MTLEHASSGMWHSHSKAHASVVFIVEDILRFVRVAGSFPFTVTCSGFLFPGTLRSHVFAPHFSSLLSHLPTDSACPPAPSCQVTVRPPHCGFSFVSVRYLPLSLHLFHLLPGVESSRQPRCLCRGSRARPPQCSRSGAAGGSFHPPSR